jgi:hypothetical protein
MRHCRLASMVAAHTAADKYANAHQSVSSRDTPDVMRRPVRAHRPLQSLCYPGSPSSRGRDNTGQYRTA